MSDSSNLPKFKGTKLNFEAENGKKQYAHQGSYPGVFPFLSGPYPTMYTGRPWTVRQYAGFSTAQESNKFYLNAMKKGQRGLSIAFDLATHRGYDSDHPRVYGDVGMAGVAIDSIKDMDILFNEIDLGKVSVSMTMNGAVLPILGLFIASGIKQGVEVADLSGTIQNDILKEFMVRNTFIFNPQDSMRIISDIFGYTSKNMPKFNSISISGYHMQEAGASADIELAYTLADGIEYIKTGIKSGIPIDQFAPRLSFFWGISMDYITEVAKLRAGRYLWAKLVKKFNPQNEKSLLLRAHCQTSGWSLTAQQVQVNIGRVGLQALAAVHGHTQSLHTNSLDEAIALPSEYSSTIARNTQLLIQHETDSCQFIDPWYGSEVVEARTQELIEQALKLIEEVEEAGGMKEAIIKGIPQRRIEESSARIQAKIDRGDRPLFGVNKFVPTTPENIKVLSIDNEAVREGQIAQIKIIKSERDNKKVEELLKNITNAASDSSMNLLECHVAAALAGATVGEMTTALEEKFPRYNPPIRVVSGIYGSMMKENASQNENYKLCLKLMEDFETKFGRRPRILVAKMGQDGHDRGQKIISSALADLGMDVDVGPLFSTPEEVAKMAMENDVHLIGVSSLAGGHKSLVPKLMDDLKKIGQGSAKIIVGGVIPPEDYEGLYEQGVFAIFGPGTNITKATIEFMQKLLKD
ncbi:methylmalonyl-CoA mutase [Bacteriovoracaceae bacterium]|nr:methylmalonyl-CoA mutase [Bacteriovoracaceae bacterium]